MPSRLPKSLIETIQNDTLIPFVGAGVSSGIKDTDNNRIFKSWTDSLLDSVQILRDENEEAASCCAKMITLVKTSSGQT